MPKPSPKENAVFLQDVSRLNQSLEKTKNAALAINSEQGKMCS